MSIKESEGFWDNVLNPSVQETSLQSTSTNTTTETVDPCTLQDPQKQHEFLDSLRSTDGIDYEKLRKEATQLVQLRLELESKKRRADYRKIGKERYPDFAKKFPQFFDAIRTVEKHRLNEFLGVMHNMLDKLVQVKKKILTHTDMRTELFERELASRYYQRPSV